MATKRAGAKPSSKRRNGEGDSITVLFDVQDRTERRAMQMSKLLAAKAGRRKQFIVAVLASLYDVFEATGELPEAHHVAALLSGAAPAVTSAPRGYSAPEPPTVTKSPVRKTASSKTPRVAVTSAPAKTSAAEIGRNFAASAGAAFFD